MFLRFDILVNLHPSLVAKVSIFFLFYSSFIICFLILFRKLPFLSCRVIFKQVYHKHKILFIIKIMKSIINIGSSIYPLIRSLFYSHLSPTGYTENLEIREWALSMSLATQLIVLGKKVGNLKNAFSVILMCLSAVNELETSPAYFLYALYIPHFLSNLDGIGKI